MSSLGTVTAEGIVQHFGIYAFLLSCYASRFPASSRVSTSDMKMVSTSTAISPQEKQTFPQLLNYSFKYDFIQNNLYIQYEADNKTQPYHEGQRGEEEADDQLDVRAVAHHQPQALTEGKGV